VIPFALLSVPEAARLLGRSAATIERWVRSGLLPVARREWRGRGNWTRLFRLNVLARLDRDARRAGGKEDAA